MACIVSVFGNEELVKNPGFEDWTGPLPENWTTKIWNPVEEFTKIYSDTVQPYSGKKCVVIENSRINDARLIQELKVRDDSIYELSCRIKTENVSPANIGAYISVLGLNEVEWDIRGTHDWQHMIVYVRVGQYFNKLTIALCLGGYGSTNTGKALFDDISVKRVDVIPADSKAPIINMGIGVAKISKYKIIPHTSFEVVLMLVFFIMLTLLALLFTIFRRNNKPILATIFPAHKKSISPASPSAPTSPGNTGTGT
jgi:hypothetical protein